MQKEVLMIILSNVMMHIPIYLAWLAGVILAVGTWKRNARPSLFAILAIASMFVLDLIGIYMSTMPLRLNRHGYTSTHIGMLLPIVNLSLAILRAGSWGLLLAAIFSGRALPAFDSKPADSL
jgi:hypothetical protein